MCLFGCFLFGTLWVSWTWMFVPLPELGMFSAIIVSNNFSGHFLLLLLTLLLCECYSTWCCPKGPIIFLHFLKIEKKKCCSAGMSAIVLSSSLLIHSSASLYLQLNPSNVLFSLVITSVWYLFSICWSARCVQPFFSWVQWASLWPWLWTLYQRDCLSPFLSVLF